MAVDKKAGVEIIVAGAAEAAAAIRRVATSWANDARSAEADFKKLGSAVTDAFAAVGREAKAVATFGTQISFSGAVGQVQSLEAATSKLAIASGRNFGDMRREIGALSEKIGASPDQIANYIATVGKQTYDFESPKKNLEAFNKFARETGRDLGETSGLAVAFKKMGVDDAERTLRQIRGTAESLKTTGGPAALADQVAALGGQFGKASNDAKQLIQITASLGKGLPAAQAQEVQQAVIGGLEGNAAAYQAHFRRTGLLKEGEHIIDPTTGKIDVAKLGQMRQAELIRRFGREKAMRIASAQFGSPLAGAAFMRANFQGFTGQESDTDAADKWAQTPGGSKAAADAMLQRTMAEDVGHGSFLGAERERIQKNAAKHPYAYWAVQNLPKGLDVPVLAYASRMQNVQERGGVGQTFQDVYSASSGLSFKERVALGWGNARVRSRAEAQAFQATSEAMGAGPVPAEGNPLAGLQNLDKKIGDAVGKALAEDRKQAKPVEVHITDATSQGIVADQPGGQQ